MASEEVKPRGVLLELSAPGEMAVDLLHFVLDVVHHLGLVVLLTPSMSLSLVQAFNQILHLSAGDLKFNPFFRTQGRV